MGRLHARDRDVSNASCHLCFPLENTTKIASRRTHISSNTSTMDRGTQSLDRGGGDSIPLPAAQVALDGLITTSPQRCQLPSQATQQRGRQRRVCLRSSLRVSRVCVVSAVFLSRTKGADLFNVSFAAAEVKSNISGRYRKRGIPGIFICCRQIGKAANRPQPFC